MTKTTLAAVLIVKNEALQLETCLQAVQAWVDEIIVIDSGSNDETENIARKFGAQFFVDPDWQGFGVQRQRAQKY